MNKDNIFKFLIPLVAVVVILESVVIVTGMANKKDVAVVDKNESVPSESVKKTEVKGAVAELVFSLDNKSLKVGQKYTVTVGGYAKKEFSVDGIDLFVKYDKDSFDVSGLSFNDTGMGKPTASKVSKDKGLVLVNYWISDPKGYAFVTDKLVNLVTFTVTPKKEGSFNFEIATGSADGTSDTMIVEKGTSKVLPFASNQLTVNVSK